MTKDQLHDRADAIRRRIKTRGPLKVYYVDGKFLTIRMEGFHTQRGWGDDKLVGVFDEGATDRVIYDELEYALRSQNV